MKIASCPVTHNNYGQQEKNRADQVQSHDSNQKKKKKKTTYVCMYVLVYIRLLVHSAEAPRPVALEAPWASMEQYHPHKIQAQTRACHIYRTAIMNCTVSHLRACPPERNATIIPMTPHRKHKDFKLYPESTYRSFGPPLSYEYP